MPIGSLLGERVSACIACGNLLYLYLDGTYRAIPSSVEIDSRYIMEAERYTRVAVEGEELYDGLSGTAPEWRTKQVMRFLANSGVRQFLDIGPGFGALEKACGTEFDIIALDPCREFMRSLKAQVPSVHCVMGVAEYLPFLTGSLECVVIDSTFQSVIDRERLLYEVARVTERNATLLLTVAYKWNYPRRPQNGFNVLREDEYQTLLRFLEELGFWISVSVVSTERRVTAMSKVCMEEGDYLWFKGVKTQQ
jgi:SAM-dependent methyltransferase